MEIINFALKIIYYYFDGGLIVANFGDIELIKAIAGEENRSDIVEAKARDIVSGLFEILTLEEFTAVMLLINQRLKETLESYKVMSEIIENK